MALLEDYGDRLDDLGREYIQHIVDSAHRMDVLVNDLLSYSRLGRAELRIQTLSLESLLDDALKLISSDIHNRNAVITFEPPLPALRGHKSTLVQIFANLISNAIKFVAPEVQPKVKIWSEACESGSIRVWCQDNGIGIDEEYQDRIFQVFERLHGIESYPGTGIGLAIVDRATERLGGRCGMESTPGNGSRFWVEFPGEELRESV